MILNATLENQFFILNDSIEHVIEYCKNSFEKIKSTIKKTDYEFLEKVNAHLKKISTILWENKKLLNDELKCFIEIEHYIIYIMSSNCKNHSFGYLKCTIFLLNMFKNLINSKFEYLLTNRNLDKYKSNLEEYPKKLYEFRQYFNENIFIKDPEFNDDIELLNLKLRGE